MQKDDSIIPVGDHCYRVVNIEENEVLCNDVNRFGKDLREYSYFGNFKEVLCPYWQRTDYGTVRCNYLDTEVIDEDDSNALKKITDYFGDATYTKKFGYSLLYDEIKVCGVNEEYDE